MHFGPMETQQPARPFTWRITEGQDQAVWIEPRLATPLGKLDRGPPTLFRVSGERGVVDPE
ncbi:Uncharacterised protein [Mycobacterium tuberculosis]|uniref:Uncharacterized protein n=1 Tax=Mycobacterium tuberculosis TaxID=1773 RepID=A0A655JD43_MYCTX|nr:Uncharacterised protein [Mycobacterium tuberculosis]CFE54698.1 Uncharacterised protein [Mycobacterium tuberculosis]CKR63838.1 Uncharacterised protein [Mycobacterium tuberculosis]COW74149.1 Uncharacterised protein [Mycobacterium tuberculosis]COX88696.1 Uncharacterised protein [Mycobacterium tuberculosis]